MDFISVCNWCSHLVDVAQTPTCKIFDWSWKVSKNLKKNPEIVFITLQKWLRATTLQGPMGPGEHSNCCESETEIKIYQSCQRHS